MVWQKIDDQFGISRKVTRIPRRNRLSAIGLWELASNYSVRSLTDGVLDAVELEEVLATAALIRELVAVDLWHAVGHDCVRCVQPPAGGIVIHDFLEYNPDASSVSAARDTKSEGGKHGNHVRWHLNRRISDPKCEWCATGEPIASASLRNPPGPVPGPVPMTDMTYDTQVSPESDVAAGSTDEGVITQARFVGVRDLTSLMVAFRECCGPITPQGTIELVRTICSRSKHPVEKVDAYVLTVIRDTPDEVRWDYERLDLGAIA